RFFFHNAATAALYTLSLHDALPISPSLRGRARVARGDRADERASEADPPDERLVLASGHDPGPALPRARTGRSLRLPAGPGPGRSEEHTSELQSRGHLVCRLLLEKK